MNEAIASTSPTLQSDRSQPSNAQFPATLRRLGAMMDILSLLAVEPYQVLSVGLGRERSERPQSLSLVDENC